MSNHLSVVRFDLGPLLQAKVKVVSHLKAVQSCPVFLVVEWEDIYKLRSPALYF